MKLSIAMCTYNGAIYLQEQLDSIGAQTRLPDELIVCDDGSKDQTGEILEAFAATAPFPVRVFVNEQNLGSLKNFEKAISLCEGDVIALSDQDDVWLPEKLRRMEAMFVAQPRAGLVFTDLEIVDQQMRPLGYRAWQSHWVEFDRKEMKLFREGKAFGVLLRRNVATGTAMAFRAEFRDLVLPIPQTTEWIIHDYWIALMISLVADLAFIDEPLVKYRQHGDQQIGLPPPISTRTRRAAQQRRRKNQPAKNYYLKLLYRQLMEKGGKKRYGSKLAELNERIIHAQMRADLSNKKFPARVRDVVKELLASRYHLSRHPDSNGLRDAAYDLLPYKALNVYDKWTAKRNLRDVPDKEPT